MRGLHQGQRRRWTDPDRDAVLGVFVVVCMDDGWCWLRYTKYEGKGRYNHESRREQYVKRYSEPA